MLNNEHIKADMIVMAVGITPNTDFMTDVVQLDKKFVVCDKYMKTSDENIYAAGDITQVPFFDTTISFVHYV